MTTDEARHDEFRARMESLFEEFRDLVAEDLTMPVVSDWVVVVTHDDLNDDRAAGYFRTYRKGQWMHRTVGLLLSTADDYRGLTRDEAD